MVQRNGYTLERTVKHLVLQILTDALDFHLKSIYGLRCSNEQRLLTFTAKADIGSPWLVNIDVVDLFSRCIKYSHSFAGKVYVTLPIPFQRKAYGRSRSHQG